MNKYVQFCLLRLFDLHQMVKKARHRGELLKTIVDSSGMKIESVARKAGYSRTSYYNHINDADLSIHILFKYGQAVNYDFSNEFPEILELAKIKNSTPTTLAQAIREIDHWKEKYFSLLEKYNSILETKKS